LKFPLPELHSAESDQTYAQDAPPQLKALAPTSGRAVLSVRLGVAELLGGGSEAGSGAPSCASQLWCNRCSDVPTLAVFVERFLAAHAAEVDPRTIRTPRERLRRPLAAFGDSRLDAVGIDDDVAWQATLPSGYRPKIVAALSQVFDRAVAWKRVSENPVRLARTGKRRVARRREIKPFTREEIDRVAIELGPTLGAMIVFMSETGLRPGRSPLWRAAISTARRASFSSGASSRADG
jgi:hypothetical protein